VAPVIDPELLSKGPPVGIETGVATGTATGTTDSGTTAATSPSGPKPAASRPSADPAAAASAAQLAQEAQKVLEKKNEESPATRAVTLAYAATRADPTNASAWLTLGGAYQNLGNAAAAQQAYRSCAAQAVGPRVVECRARAGLPRE
jgi:hypothetical protein